jgi:hypothetical protein
MLMLVVMLVAGGCAAYKPSPTQDVNRDGHVTFYGDDPGAWRSESDRHMDRQSRNRSTAVKASEY